MPELIPAEPGTAEWLAARRQGVTATDAFVRELGRVTDLDGIPVTVGVDYGAVTISGCKLAGVALEEFARLFTAAHWQAAADRIVIDLAKEVPGARSLD